MMDFDELIEYGIRWLFLLSCGMFGAFISGFRFENSDTNLFLGVVSGLFVALFFSSVNETRQDKKKYKKY
jgi:hypothetical protein